ncbi:MAG: hypothetical protein MJ051_01200 [Akkermansia sp.]|nr:hypothetical protein [Akkermansia sp.]
MKTAALLFAALACPSLFAAETDFLTAFDNTDTDEATLLAHWSAEAIPAPEQRAGLVSAAVFRSQPRLLRRFLEAGCPVEDGLSSVVYLADERGPHWQEMLDMLLAAGADPDAHEAEEPAPLWIAASLLPHAAMEQVVETLLAHGADASCTRDGLSAADYIAAHPAFAARLRAKGYTIAPAPAALSPEYPMEEQEREIIRMAMIHADAAPFAEALEKVMLDGKLQESLVEALMLLHRADPARATRVGNVLVEEYTDAVAEVARREPGFRLDAAHLAELAHRKPEIAYPLCSMLGYFDGTDELIESLLDDEEPAVEAAAWKAKLTKAGLPVAEVGEVAEWLAKRGLKAEKMSSAVQRLVLMTSWDLYMDGKLSAEEQASFLQAYQDMGLERAHELLRRPEEMDCFFEEETWYPAVTEISRTIWKHRAEFSAKEAH